MRFNILRSGSSGNCTLIEHGGTRVLLDAGGFSLKRLREILAEAQVAPERLAGVVVSHLHADHVNASTLKLCREHRVGMWVHGACLPALHDWFGRTLVDSVTVHAFSDRKVRIGELSFRPFTVMHDARGTTCGFRFWPLDREEHSVSYAADLGQFTDDLCAHFAGSRVVVIESNHDEGMLWANPRRTMANKNRVVGTFGHLSNSQCGAAVVSMVRASRSRPRRVILAHLSEENNTPQKAVETVGQAIEDEGFEVELCCAHRARATGWVEV